MTIDTRAEIDYRGRLEQLKALEVAGINPYPAEPPKISHKNLEVLQNFSNLQGVDVSVVGRVQFWRDLGGLVFAPIEDETAALQIVVAEQRLKQPSFELVRDNFGRGDFIAASGLVERTRTGEVSVFAKEITMLAKALRVPPFKIEDPDILQRQRYLQTLIDSNVRNRFRTRAAIVEQMRTYFIKLGCTEVETPVLDITYGGANARPFVTFHNAHNTELYMRIANELYLKKMTVGGYYEGVFEFSRDFRNEGVDAIHNPEFTQVEMYKPFWDYQMMMSMAEDLMESIAFRIHGTTRINYNGQEIDLKSPWRRLTIYDGLRQKLGIEPETISDYDLTELAHINGVDKPTRGEKLLGLFEEVWRDNLIQPTFVMDYPAETSSLTKRHRENPALTERFEAFVGGMEVMNSYSELNDPRDQQERFDLEGKKRDSGDNEAMPRDEDFLIALEYGMPPQAGIGISIDRWAMILTNTPHIRNVIYFPTLRPRHKVENRNIIDGATG